MQHDTSMPLFLARLAERNRFGMRPGLDTLRAVLARLGNPEREIAAVHIAGTNGKGSTAAFIDAVLRAAGLPCGRYTSPHLLRFNERICVNGEAVADDILQSASDEVEAAEKGLPPDTQPATFFEMATAMAFCVFRSLGIRLVVLETGLGGRLDATNVVEPLVSVITRVGFDHMGVLGNTLAEIAAEKAGIIKPGRPVVVADMPEEAREVVPARARDACAALHDARGTTVARVKFAAGGLTFDLETPSRNIARLTTPLAGAYQVENIAAAVATLEALEPLLGIEIPDAAFREGFASVAWPGRFQTICESPWMILDGGHNADCAEALRAALKAARFNGPAALVAGFCKDKDMGAFLKILAPQTARAWAVEVGSPRTESRDAVAAAMRLAGISNAQPATLAEALDAARAWAVENAGRVLVCGSLFLVGDVLQTRASRRDPGENMKRNTE
ncbi:MAG: bifunctional folylpolyglutamate synthase/dihydrofolate synthase [Kiritimatiellaeota bacterium]|nr:bifunctional folylpolyglutamate synthase/dihydrofolate synthase [Kiritimatiellota bacterium]